MKKDQIKLIAGNVNAYRKAKGWTQTELADKIGVHLTHISRIETGKYIPSAEDLINLAELFEVTVDDIISNVSDKKRTDEAVQNTPLYKKIKLVEELNDKDKNTILNVIDSIITKHKMKGFMQQELA